MKAQQAGDALPRARDTPNDRQRRTVLVRILVAGAIITVFGTALVGVGGADGRAGMQWMLTLASSTLMIVGVFGAVGGVIDQARQFPISGRRTIIIVAAFAGALLAVAMLTALQVGAQRPD